MATFAENHLQFRIHGHFGTAPTDQIEHWSVGFRVRIGAAAPAEDKKQAFLLAMKPRVQSFHENATVHPGTHVYVSKLTAAYIGTDGHYVGGDSQPTTEEFFSPAIAGSGTTGAPYSHARAFTLRTDIDRGRGAYGRFYYPTSDLVDSTGRWSSSAVLSAANAGASFVNDINVAARAQWATNASVCVFSTYGTAVGVVLNVGVGRAPDTQRRRDNRLAEEHYYALVPGMTALNRERAKRVYGEPNSAEE